MYSPVTIVTAIGAVISIIGGLLGFLGFPAIIQNEIRKSVTLQKDSDAFKRWQDLGIPIVSKFYFFNVSNSEDVQNGAKPIVKEIGPYIYNQYRRKVNITGDGDVLSYRQHQIFKFDEKASAPLRETDKITIVNVPLISTAIIAEHIAGTFHYQLTLLDSSIPTIFNNPNSIFLTTTPKDFLFDGVDVMCDGYNVLNIIVCKFIEAFTSTMMPRLEDGRFRFSLYGYKNDTLGEYLSINNGQTDINQLGQIIAWKNMTSIDTWTKNSSCNRIVGTDAGLYPPLRTTESVLYHFNTDVCRSVNARYLENAKISGIDVYRYLFDENMFASPSNYSNNECFCLNHDDGIRGDDGCLLDGVMDLRDCIGAPVVVSFPHFYQANEVYQNGVDGLSPDKSRHRIYLDLEPMTGSVLRGSKRVQVNIFIRPINRISLTTNLSTTLMPIVWIDESFDVNDEYIDLLNTKLFDVLEILRIIKWSVITCGGILFTLGFIGLLKSMWEPSEFSKLI